MLTEMNLTEAEIRVLNDERFAYPCPKIQKRFHTVYLKSAYGYSNVEICRILDIHRNSVTNYIKMYREKGIEGLYSTGYHGSVSEQETGKTGIIEDFKNSPVCTVKQAIQRIKDLTGIERKPTQVRAFMHRHGFKYRKLSPIPGKLNPEEQKQFFEQKLQPVIDKA
ncbi:MAG: helix-turn-helix domain-containing protein [Prevotellaceae bacterium]|jgi:transposase|nr:helix-turn-helix domain-containing protein [Prevotellaceae bacterium]